MISSTHDWFTSFFEHYAIFQMVLHIDCKCHFCSQIPHVSVEETTEAQITAMVGAAVEATNVAPTGSLGYFNRRNSKRQRCGQSKVTGSTENDGQHGSHVAVEENPPSIASSLKDLGTKVSPVYAWN